MPILTTNLTTWSTVALGGATIVWNPATAGNAMTADGSITDFATPVVVGGGPHATDFVQGVTLETTALMSSLNSINVRVKRKATGTADYCRDQLVHLVAGGVVLSAIDKSTNTDYTTTLTYEDHVFSSSDLATLGVTPASLTGQFGAVVACEWSNFSTGSAGLPGIDHIELVIDYNSVPLGGATVIGKGLVNDRIFGGSVIS
jgi:hypothetical protein